MLKPASVAVTIGRFTREEHAQDLVEYGLLASLIATFVVGALTMFGGRVNLIWSAISATKY